MTHKQTVTAYMVAHATDSGELAELVNKAIHANWQPYGDLIVHTNPNGKVTLIQAMVKY